MRLNVLAISISYHLFDYLSSHLKQHGITVQYALTVDDGIRIFSQQLCHLVIIDLKGTNAQYQKELLYGLRRSKVVPILAIVNGWQLSHAAAMIDCGVDICLPSESPSLAIAKSAFSLVRRYTTYNRYDQPERFEAAPFYCGDFYIDPLRREVMANGKQIRLRKREFSLLLYFMKNPNIVLTNDQICEKIWKATCAYSLAQAVSELRKRIEPNPSHFVYIETVYRVGYRFTAYTSETCEN